MKTLQEKGQKAQEAKYVLANLSKTKKNDVLSACADAMMIDIDRILKANEKDMVAAKEKEKSAAFLDRLLLTKERVEEMAKGIYDVARLPDPIGKMLSYDVMENGMEIRKKRVPIGVIGIIFEARPNVCSDAFALCFKSGNAVILRGGKEAIHTNQELVSVFRDTLAHLGVPKDAVQIIEDTSRETAKKMMKLNEYIDVLIPRGGTDLIKSVVKNSTVPVIETGAGNCHIYVDISADLQKAVNIVMNAKVQRPGVCNSCETLLIHKFVFDKFMPLMAEALTKAGVEIRGDDKVCATVNEAVLAKEKDYETEFNDLILAVKVVDSMEEAVLHIRKYSTGHSEAIVTENYSKAQKFLNEVDSAAVYVNVSTRFTDGSQFGMGAEIGISTQKLHARGPMGLEELTSTKYVILGTGQIRE
ncbi:MAG: glutamate-5-semialdehyde dehydrogenase [Bacillota bacterium]